MAYLSPNMAEPNFIDRIRIQNFKGFENQTFDFLERLTVVIGDNGAGKTALLDALKGITIS